LRRVLLGRRLLRRCLGRDLLLLLRLLLLLGLLRLLSVRLGTARRGQRTLLALLLLRWCGLSLGWRLLEALTLWGLLELALRLLELPLLRRS